jgi:CHAD domain-containing protein
MPSSSTTAAEFVTAVVDDLVPALDDAVVAVRADAPEGVHDFRKAVRRLRSALAAYRGALDPITTERVRAELRDLGRTAGSARDAEVLRHGLADAVGRVPDRWLDGLAAERLRLRFAERYEEEAARFRLVLDSTVFAETRARLGTLLGESAPLGPQAGESAERFVGARLRHERHRVRSAARHEADAALRPSDGPADGTGDGPPRGLEVLHAVRKAARRLRYAAEAGGAVHDVRKRTVRRARHMQEVLGDALDALHAAQAYRETAAQAFRGSEDTFGYGAVAAAAHATAAERIAAYRELPLP